MKFFNKILSFNEFSDAIKRSICLIEIATKNSNDYSYSISGTGFFIEIQIPSRKNPLYGLITTNHILNEKALKSEKSFTIYMANKEEKGIKIKIKDNDNMFIFTSELIDITFIELNSKIIENINPYFLHSSKKDAEINDPVLIFQYPKQIFSLAYGSIKAIHSFDYYHKVSTYYGSGGSPLLNENFEVVSVHKSKGSLKNENNDNEQFNVAVKFSEIEYALRTLYNSKNEYGIEKAKKSSKKLNEIQIKELKEHGLELKFHSINKDIKLQKHDAKILKKSLFYCNFSEKVLFYKTNYSWYITILSQENNILKYNLNNLKKLEWIHINPNCEVLEENISSKLNKKENELIEWLKSTEFKYL